MTKKLRTLLFLISFNPATQVCASFQPSSPSTNAPTSSYNNTHYTYQPLDVELNGYDNNTVQNPFDDNNILFNQQSFSDYDNQRSPYELDPFDDNDILFNQQSFSDYDNQTLPYEREPFNGNTGYYTAPSNIQIDHTPTFQSINDDFLDDSYFFQQPPKRPRAELFLPETLNRKKKKPKRQNKKPLPHPKKQKISHPANFYNNQRSPSKKKRKHNIPRFECFSPRTNALLGHPPVFDEDIDLRETLVKKASHNRETLPPLNLQKNNLSLPQQNPQNAYKTIKMRPLPYSQELIDEIFPQKPITPKLPAWMLLLAQAYGEQENTPQRTHTLPQPPKKSTQNNKKYPPIIITQISQRPYIYFECKLCNIFFTSKKKWQDHHFYQKHGKTYEVTRINKPF